MKMATEKLVLHIHIILGANDRIVVTGLARDGPSNIIQVTGKALNTCLYPAGNLQALIFQSYYPTCFFPVVWRQGIAALFSSATFCCITAAGALGRARTHRAVEGLHWGQLPVAESLLSQQGFLMDRLERQTPIKLSKGSDKPLLAHQGISTWHVPLDHVFKSSFSIPIFQFRDLLVVHRPSLEKNCLFAPLTPHSFLSQVPMMSPSPAPGEP